MSDWEGVLERLYATIASRKTADPGSSYTAKLLHQGRSVIAQKMGEEAVETAIAAVGNDSDAVVAESADLIYHLLVVLAARGIRLAQVEARLAERTRQSGLQEKASRKRARLKTRPRQARGGRQSGSPSVRKIVRRDPGKPGAR